MLRYLTFIFSLFAFSTADAQKFTIDDIPLQWSDFSSKSKYESNTHTAIVGTGLTREYSKIVTEGNTKIFGDIHFRIDKGGSKVEEGFIKTASSDDKEALLNHERSHVIIGLICLKKMQNALANYPFTVKYKLEADSILTYLWMQAQTANKDYDMDTNHSLNTDRQRIWEQSLMMQLNKLYAADDKFLFDIKIELHIDS